MRFLFLILFISCSTVDIKPSIAQISLVSKDKYFIKCTDKRALIVDINNIAYDNLMNVASGFCKKSKAKGVGNQ